MQEFMRKFIQLNGAEAKVILEHCLFDRQAFYCDELKTVSDAQRIGLILKNQEIFIFKKDVQVAQVEDDALMISDGKLTMTIIVSNL